MITLLDRIYFVSNGVKTFIYGSPLLFTYMMVIEYKG